MDNLSSWLQENLTKILGFPVGNDLINYMLSFDNEHDLQEHLGSLLDMEDDTCKVFYKEFMQKWRILQKRNTAKPNTTKSTSQVVFTEQTKNKENITPIKYAICREDTDNLSKTPPNVMRVDMAGSIFSGKTPPRLAQTDTSKSALFEKTPPNFMRVDMSGAAFLDKNRIMENEAHSGKSPSPFKKKQLKFVPLYKSDGKLTTSTTMLPGRHACRCLAQRHKLINNCMECGRIVCEQEGSGPCLFCGNLVCTIEDMNAIQRDSKKSKKLKEKLMSQLPEDVDVQAGLEKALQHKDKLLEFDKNCAKRTKVIDDEADYFSHDSLWLSKKERAARKKKEDEMREKRFASRLDKKYTLDFAGRKVVGDEETMYTYDNEETSTRNNSVEFLSSLERSPLRNCEEQSSLIDPRITITPPRFSCTQSFDENVTKLLKSQQEAVKNSLRLQDKGLQEIVDKGMCLSIHQPWASLLVHGIKKLEGRSWYTSHRGRLWIASTVKQPEKEVIQQIENQYKSVYKGKEVNFPKQYPTSALLGCVNVVDCVENEEYFQSHPDDPEESSSPFLFVCDNPQRLKFAFTMKGKHKIYRLEPHVHAAVRKCLLEE